MPIKRVPLNGVYSFIGRHRQHPDYGHRNESFNFSAGALTPKLFVWIWDHRTLGKDRLLGEAEIDVRYVLEFSEVALNQSCFRFGGIYNLQLYYQQKCPRN
jgi:hypothetical protein